LEPLIRIKRLIILGRYYFTDKAEIEIERESLTEEEVLEAIINAPIITKTIRSDRKSSEGTPEYLYIIPGMTSRV